MALRHASAKSFRQQSARMNSSGVTKATHAVQPCKTKATRWQQTVGVLFYLGIFLGLAWSWPLLLLLIALPVVRLPAVVYFVYIILTSKSYATRTNRGARPPPVQRWKIWHWLADYFPIRLHKTVDLDPGRSYLICNAPHGIFSFGAVFSFCTDAAGFPVLFPGIECRGATLQWNFYLPFVRELELLWGAVGCGFDTLVKCLSRSGSAVLLEIGGTSEALHSRPHTYDIILNQRKGFVRVAMRSGACLVPAISFGETNTYQTRNDLPEGHPMRKWQKLLMKIGGYTMPVFSGALGPFPLPAPINTVVGTPIPVHKFDGDFKSPEGKKLIEEYHAKFVAGVKQLWEDYKDTFAIDREKELTIVA